MSFQGGNERFNAEAAAWDSNPDVHRASDGALQAILAAHPSLTKKGSSSSSPPAPPNTTDVLEIGCGTGLLSLRLAPYVRSIVAVDAAEGMVRALEMKLEGPDSEMKAKISPLYRAYSVVVLFFCFPCLHTWVPICLSYITNLPAGGHSFPTPC